MPGSDVTIPSSEGGTFSCYIARPTGDQSTPAAVLASSIDGVDADLRDIADALAESGFIAVAPDLFWRTIPGPLLSGDPRTQERSQPRMQRLAENEQDLVDTLRYLATLPAWNGRAAVMGFCYGGPFSIVGPRRLGYDAGIACHGSQMLEFIGDLTGVSQPVCIVWGDLDHRAPKPVLDAFTEAARNLPNLEVRIFPGVEHGFMMPSSSAFDRAARDFSMQRTHEILESLRHAQQSPGT